MVSAIQTCSFQLESQGGCAIASHQHCSSPFGLSPVHQKLNSPMTHSVCSHRLWPYPSVDMGDGEPTLYQGAASVVDVVAVVGETQESVAVLP